MYLYLLTYSRCKNSNVKNSSSVLHSKCIYIVSYVDYNKHLDSNGLSELGTNLKNCCSDLTVDNFVFMSPLNLDFSNLILSCCKSINLPIIYLLYITIFIILALIILFINAIKPASAGLKMIPGSIPIPPQVIGQPSPGNRMPGVYLPNGLAFPYPGGTVEPVTGARGPGIQIGKGNKIGQR